MSYLISNLSSNFKNMETLVDQLLDLYVHAINSEFENYENIKWISIGYEQRFSVAVGDEDDQSRYNLISILEYGTKYYDLIEKIETGLTDAPFFTALLTVIVPQLQKQIETDFAGKLDKDFKIFVWTDDEWYHDSEVEVPSFEEYFDLLEEIADEDEENEVEYAKENLLNWIKGFCTTDKLRNYLLDILNDKYKGQTLAVIAKEWNS